MSILCFSIASSLLYTLYSYTPSYLHDNVAAAVIGVALCGTIAGQLFFGWLGDKMSRKRVYGMTLMLVVVCSITSGLSFGKDPKVVMSIVCFFRFWLGFGIGGDYPLSTTIISKHANKKTHGAFIDAVSTMRGFGIFADGMVVIITFSVFNAKFPAPIYAVDRIRSTVPENDYLWHIIMMFEVIPPALTYTVVFMTRPSFGVKLAMVVYSDFRGPFISASSVVSHCKNRAYGMTLILVVVCQLLLAGWVIKWIENVLNSFNKDPKAAMSTVCFFHFWLDFGIGGDYPLSIIIMFENANKKTRGAFIDVISAMQGFGIFAGGMVAIITSAAFNAKFSALIYGLIAFDQLCLKLITFGGVEKLLTRASHGRATITSSKSLDVAKTQWYHITAVVIAGMGFCTDAYDLFCIPLVTKLLGWIYYHKEGSYTPGYLPDNVAASIIGVALCGTIAGQLFFSWLGDKMGRKRAYGITLMLVVVCLIASGISFGKDHKAVTSTVYFFHFSLGFSIGCFGILASGMVAIITSAAFNAKFPASIYAVDRIRSTVPKDDYLRLNHTIHKRAYQSRLQK
ncbi:hypothetical protein JRO89_XS03G0041100 [Xanthoceras sorbifolium]|uniref:Major facilitator superfamily (MFS) profile domain-containing protein n=1 Tax=Xanthoceras sorbifolium TaxID=99658 RepID=A0ABQ8I8R9_9ROSI|nr:hypothetical protein JRO89_XS03G0041100 [Xanthoceras sorbifolium]